MAVNESLNFLYWDIGRQILNRQHQEGWGSKRHQPPFADLHRAFPEQGFSPATWVT